MPLDAQLMERLFDSPELPSLPAIALQIIELVQEDEVDVDKIAQTISLDPALSTKMLKTVNSSFYGQSKTVGSVQQAVVVLGLNSVKTLALGFSLVSNLTDAGGDNFDPIGFWRRSLYGATAAKQLCERLNIVQAEEVFMSSLLQDVGVLALAQVLGRTYTPLLRRTADSHRDLAALERESLGGDHMEVGAALAESWGLPPLLVESIRLHERPDEAPENLMPLIRTVGAGALAADVIENPDEGDRVSDFYQQMEQWFAFDRGQADELLRSVFEHAGEAQRLFELPAGELADPDEIMKKAGEVLRRIAAEVPATPVNEQAQAAEPITAHHDAAAPDANGEPDPAADPPAKHAEPAPAQAPAQAATPEVAGDPPPAGPGHDPLTGLRDRRQFEERLDERFLEADHKRPISVLFIDIDQFKQVNDQHGTPAGDAVLRDLAETLRDLVKRRGEAFRYEEDAFTALCPGMNRHDAALLGETLRSVIELARFDVAEGEGTPKAAITASVGVATYEGDLFKRGDQLLKAASKGVLAAKDGGQNLVRVFVPKTKPQGKSEAA